MPMDLVKALNEATTTAGGYLVPEEFATRLFELVQAQAVTIPDCMQVTMNHDQLHFPTVTTGSTAYFVAENATITAADAAFGRVTLNAQKVAALMQVSTELLEDSNPSVQEAVTQQMARDLALKIDNEILNGTGTNFAGYRDTTTYTNINTVTAATNGDAITVDKISDAVSAIQQDFFEPDTLYIHPRTLGALRVLKDTNNRYLFDEAMFGSPILAGGAVGTVWGLKVKVAGQLPTTITQGTATTCTDLVVLASGKSGIFGRRRELQFNKFYDITIDAVKLQANMRAGFRVPYEKSICIIQDITS